MAKKKGKKGKMISRKKEKRPQESKTAKAGSIEFCKKCGTILVPAKKGKTIAFKCRHCGYETKKHAQILKIVEEKKNKKGVVILEKDITYLPMTEIECPKCGNRQAWYWLQQTRSADEPPTQFFRCTKCKGVWREYK